MSYLIRKPPKLSKEATEKFKVRIELSFNETLIICPHCKAELIKEINIFPSEKRDVSRDMCPECWKFI